MGKEYNNYTDRMKWIAPLLVYLVVGVGMFFFHSAWGTLLAFHATIIVSLLIARPGIPVSVLFKSKSVKWIILNILLCGSSGLFILFLGDLFGLTENLAEQVQVLGLNASTWPLFIAYFSLVNPFIEEYFWRGYLGSKTKSLHSSDFLYAGFHALILVNTVQMVSVIFGVSVLVVAGWFWRQVAREDDGLLAPVLGHMAADFAILFAVYSTLH